MKTVDNEIRDLALTFIEKAKADNKRSLLAKPDTHVHRHAPRGQPEDAQPEWLVGRGSRHGLA
jgi:hypothetical protein